MFGSFILVMCTWHHCIEPAAPWVTRPTEAECEVATVAEVNWQGRVSYTWINVECRQIGYT